MGGCGSGAPAASGVGGGQQAAGGIGGDAGGGLPASGGQVNVTSGGGGAAAMSGQVADAGSPSDAGTPPSNHADAGQTHAPTDAAVMDAAVANGCNLPAAPADICAALPTGKVSPCSQDGAQPSQTGYLEIDSPGSSPRYVCATSWSSDPSIGYIFGQPGTFMSQAQSCCGGAVSATAAPTVPVPSIGSLGTPRIPNHLKPQETQQPGSGMIRQDPFAIVVTDTKSGAAATQAISSWLPWGGDGKPHPAPDGTGAYYFATGFPINYVVLETADGFPVIVIGPEVSLTSDGKQPVGHPTLGACAAGGGAALALAAGEIHGTVINNRSGRYDYGPSATPQALDSAAKLFNCMGIQVTGTTYSAPKM
ncbi:MAG: hypothetical protein ACJ8F1_18485 [Polyangia bacterium]